MAEILTESFCERCGTRYTFQSPPRSANPLGMLSTVGRGIRNYVAMPDASFNEAFAAARAETEQGATAHQLEAFQRTFNFCLSCRQYTCADCWNAVEGQCLSCSPVPEAELRAASTTVAETIAIPTSIGAAPAYPLGPADLAWPVLEVDDLATAVELETVPEAPEWAPPPVDQWRVADDAVVEEAPEPEAIAEPVEPEAEVGAVAEPVATELDQGEPAPEAAELPPEAEAAELPPEPAPEAAELPPEPAPEAAELPPEAEAAELPPEPAPEAAELPPEPALEAAELPPEPAPEAAELPPEPAPEAAELPPEPAPEAAELPPEPAPEAAPVAAPRRPSAPPGFTPGVSLDDQIAAYDLRIAALAAASPLAAGTSRPAEFVAPAVIASMIAPPASVTPPAAVARPESHLAPMEAIPETPPETASGTPTGTCPSCGLSLSASARFCRRCGTQQHP
jgi:hypothetical protein